MSHEIRTPMNAILGYAQLLRRNPGLDASQKQRIDVIHSSANHLLTLINDILEMSKIEAGRTTLTVEPFDLHTLLQDVRLMFTQISKAKGVALTFEQDADLPRMLEGDDGKIRQVGHQPSEQRVEVHRAGSNRRAGLGSSGRRRSLPRDHLCRRHGAGYRTRTCGQDFRGVRPGRFIYANGRNRPGADHQPQLRAHDAGRFSAFRAPQARAAYSRSHSTRMPLRQSNCPGAHFTRCH
jgi:hypothetical protein